MVSPSHSSRGITILAVVGALALGACGSSSSSGPNNSAGKVTNVSMGIEPWIGYAPWYIAQQQGFFAKHGLSVKIVNFAQDADRNAGLLAGQTNVSNIDTGRTVQFAAKNQGATPLMLEDASVGADAILASPSITGASQLQGQSVAYENGTTSDLLLHYYLAQNHIAFNAIKSVNVPAANAGTLLIADKSKVVVTYEPYVSEATSGANGSKAHVLYSSAQAPGLISDLLVANPAWLKSNPAAAKELTAAWGDAIAYFKTNRQSAIAIMAKGVGATTSSLEPTLAGLRLYSIADNQSLIKSGELAKTYTSIGNTLASTGVISKPVALSSVANFNYLGG